MTNDHIDDLTEKLDKEGAEYLIIVFKDINEGARITSSIKNLDQEFTFPKRETSITKRESLIELVEFILKEEL